MTRNDTDADECTAPARDLDARSVRALTEKMTVLPDLGRARGADDLYLVVSQSGREYLVDAREQTCECPDAERRDPEGGCKHARRVRYALGIRAIPAWVDADGVDDQIGAHVDATPRVAATDGGTALEDGRDEAGAARPEACVCSPRFEQLACWPCFRAGFETPNPDVDADAGRE